MMMWTSAKRGTAPAWRPGEENLRTMRRVERTVAVLKAGARVARPIRARASERTLIFMAVGR